MPFKPKSTKVVGRGDWAVEVPTPPKHATHVVLTTYPELKGNGKPKRSTQRIDDFGAFTGVSGAFSYIRMDNRGKVHERFPESYSWTGKEVLF